MLNNQFKMKNSDIYVEFIKYLKVEEKKLLNFFVDSKAKETQILKIWKNTILYSFINEALKKDPLFYVQLKTMY